MNVIENFNKAISYIEDNLGDEIDLNDVAKVASYSSYHFLRMFSALTGIGVYEYIKKRRMTKAAEELQTTDIKIIDLAIKYGYESPTAFNRAFQSIHGVAPSVARKDSINLNSYLPITFNLTITGGEKMNYCIEEIKEFRAIGYKQTYSFKTGETFEEIPLFWTEVKKDGRFQKLLELNNATPMGLLGICTNQTDSEFDYFIACASTHDEEMEEVLIKTQTYAIFTCSIEKIQETTKKILTEWLPNSDYDHAVNSPELEIYPDDKTCKICIPIKK